MKNFQGDCCFNIVQLDDVTSVPEMLIISRHIEIDILGIKGIFWNLSFIYIKIYEFINKTIKSITKIGKKSHIIHSLNDSQYQSL